MLTSEGKHRKTNENLLQKKEAHLPLDPDSYRDSQKFTITP